MLKQRHSNAPVTRGEQEMKTLLKREREGLEGRGQEDEQIHRAFKA